MTFSIVRLGTPRYLLPGPPLSSSAAIYSEWGLDGLKYRMANQPLAMATAMAIAMAMAVVRPVVDS